MEAILINHEPKLASKARLKYDKVREQHLLLLPERVVVLNKSAFSILSLCDGNHTLHKMAKELRDSLRVNSEEEKIVDLPDLNEMVSDISKFVNEMADQGWVVIH